MIYQLRHAVPALEVPYREAYNKIEMDGSFLLNLDLDCLKAAVSTTNSGFFSLVAARVKILFTCGMWVFDRDVRDLFARQVIAVNSRALDLFCGGNQEVKGLLDKISRLKLLSTIYESEKFYEGAKFSKERLTRSLDSLQKILKDNYPEEAFLNILKASKVKETFSPLYPSQKINGDENYNETILNQSVFIPWDGLNVRVGPKLLRDYR